MASEFLQDLGASLGIFKQGVEHLGMQRAIAQANEQVQQIRDSSLAEDEKQQQFRNLSQDMTMKFMQAGAPESQIQTFQNAFSPKAPTLQTPEEAVLMGNSKQRAAGQGLLEQKHQFEMEKQRESLDNKLASAALKNQGATQKIVDKGFMDLKSDMDPNKARGGELAKSQGVLNRLGRLDAVFTQFPDNNIPLANTVELASGLAAVYSGGSPQSQHQIDQIVPASIRGDKNKILSWYYGDNRGLEQQKFIETLKESSAREREVIEGQIKQAQVSRLPAYSPLKEKDPIRYNSILRGYNISEEDVQKYGPARSVAATPGGADQPASPSNAVAPSTQVGPSKYFR